MTTGIDASIVEALAALWRLPAPGPDNLPAHPAFVRLRDACSKAYGVSGRNGPTLALSAALRSLGLPCHLPTNDDALALPVESAVRELDHAFRATRVRRLHLAPLDLAEDVPTLAFGPARVGRFAPDELRDFVDAERLQRVFPQTAFDAERLSQFHRLVVEEDVTVAANPEARASPMLYSDLSKDLGRIEPHGSQYPGIFEDALFFLILAPWETWPPDAGGRLAGLPDPMGSHGGSGHLRPLHPTTGSGDAELGGRPV